MTGELDRRRLLLAGAGVATTAALITFEPAAAGETKRTKTFKGWLEPEKAPDWVYLPFVVPKGVRAISVKYSYEPMDVGPTTFNTVDIGIFDSSGKGLGKGAGFRGWSGGKRSSFRIDRSTATPGYLAGPISPGRWHIVLGPYQLVDPGTPYRVDVTLHFGKLAGKPFKRNPPARSVVGRGAGWYRGDLHVHTVHSDGSQTPKQVVARARAAGLDFIGTSEHNTSSATRVFGGATPKDFLVITGEEVTTRAGHWLATGLPAGAWIDWRYRPEDNKLATFTSKTRALGGLAIAAHPFQIGTGNGWKFGDDFAEMDALEVWNGPWSGLNATANEKAVAHWQKMLTDGVFKPAVGNSDTHNPTQQIGLAHTVVRSTSLSVKDLIAGYRAGHSWITGSSAVDLTFTASRGGATAECGDHLGGGSGDAAVHLQVSGVPDGAVANLIGPGPASGLPLAVGTAVGGAITLDHTAPGGTAWVRVEVRSAGAMVAMTNPIFLT